MRDISAERVGLLEGHQRLCAWKSHPGSSSSGATHVPHPAEPIHVPHPEERPLGRVSKDAHIPIKPAQTLPAFSSLRGGDLSSLAVATKEAEFAIDGPELGNREGAEN
jgi:hypothetical protein